ncbi:2OG-Fe(II) oxygenase [Synechococcus elongatus IITB7]|uniref:2OG-Fe(II) oxygenase n=1 Tax=Synechococcus elongatus TaxID=32046 RepID=UPI0030CF5E12
MGTTLAPATFLDPQVLASLEVNAFLQRSPFPWLNPAGLLSAEAFEQLCEQFPPLSLFERHESRSRHFGQRPHDRYYLAYETSIYHGAAADSGPGVARLEDLPLPWQQFLTELQTSEPFHQFIRQALGSDRYIMRFAWHVGTGGSEVSPHLDSELKIGTLIFYFNTDANWDPAWGGATLVLGDRQTQAMNPDFNEFGIVIQTQFLNNRCFFFRNTPEAWHGVEALTCPEGQQRRLFNVIFEVPDSRPESGSQTRSKRQRLKQVIRRLWPL